MTRVITCLYCDSPNTSKVLKVGDIRYFPQDIFIVTKCDSCGICFTAPKLDEESIKKYYPGDYGAYTSKEQISSIFQMVRTHPLGLTGQISNTLRRFYGKNLHNELWGLGFKRFKAKLTGLLYRLAFDLVLKGDFYAEDLPLKQGKTKLLWIGSGSPKVFAKLKHQFNMNISIIHLNEEMVNAYRAEGLNAQLGTIKSLNLEKDSFDLIFFSHVIEHLLDPRQEVAKLAKWLHPNGTMIVLFPDYGSLEWNTGSTYYDVPRHQTHLTHNSANMIFKNAGLQVLKSMNTPYGWGLFQNKYFKKYLQSGKIDKKCFGGMLQIRHRLLSTALSFFGHSGNAVFYLKKR